jgi:hypothetical protein
MISADISRSDLVLPRFLAVVLFGLGAFMGLPVAAAALGYLISGNWRVALLMASFLPIVWATVWLGRVIWSGRPIPMWFTFTLGGLISAVPAAGLLLKGEWMGALGTLGLFLPFLAMLVSGMRGNYGKPAKPKVFDDELA